MPPTPHRSVSMQALNDDALVVWPGMTIYWIGDLTHQGEVSGHNPDDYPPLRAELTDADSDPEVRAEDFMIGPRFSANDAQRLVTALRVGPDKGRVYYIIYNRTIYRRATNFSPEHYSGGDPHTDHVHVSGWVGDDANGSHWTSVLALGPQEDADMAVVYRTPVGYFVSDGVSRRGPIRTSGSVFKPAVEIPGYKQIELTEAGRTAAGSQTWEAYLDDVAGPLLPAAALPEHTHPIASSLIPATETGPAGG